MGIAGSKALTVVLRQTEDDEKLLLLRITTSEIYALTAVVEMGLIKESNKLKVCVNSCAIKNTALKENSGRYYLPCGLSAWIQAKVTGIILT